MVEQTTHIFDVARHLIGDAASVTAEALMVPRDEFPDADVAAVSAALVRFESGAIGSFTSTGILRWPHRVGLHLVSEGMVLELGEHELMVDVGRGRPLTHPTRDPFKAELRDFLDAASGGDNRVRVPFAEALRTHRLAVAASRSAREGRTINVSERTRVGSAS
jgi:predicted dehydrogenase